MVCEVTGLEAFLLGLGLGERPFQFGVGIRPQCLQLIEPWRLVPHLGQWLNDISSSQVAALLRQTLYAGMQICLVNGPDKHLILLHNIMAESM